MKEARTVRRYVLMVVAASLLAPTAAQAHVTLQPDTAPAGGFTRLDVRVPNERDDAGTTQVDVQLPPGFISAAYEPVPGWRVKLTRSKAAEPIDAGEGLKSDEQVSRITWTGDGKRGVIKPREFQDFGLSLRIPDGKAGDKLTFKALQTYDDGQIVRWIGPEDADEPAPIVTLEAGSAGGGHGAPAASTGGAGGQTASPGVAASAADGRSDTLSIVALVVGGLALIAALGALAAARRTASSTRHEEVTA
jgi:periplasmic copper chaperone A